MWYASSCSSPARPTQHRYCHHDSSITLSTYRNHPDSPISVYTCFVCLLELSAALSDQGAPVSAKFCVGCVPDPALNIYTYIFI
jgi:hypothetical protein